MKTVTRADEIQIEVIAKGHLWDAFDQGRWAHACGARREDNPHGPFYDGYFHVNMADWWHGWDEEEARSKAAGLDAYTARKRAFRNIAQHEQRYREAT